MVVKQNIAIVKCDCWIGILNDYDQSDTNNLYMGSYIKVLSERSKLSRAFKSYFNDSNPAIMPEQYIDRRRGYAVLFDYCPNCGERIEWPKLRKFLRDTLCKPNNSLQATSASAPIVSGVVAER